MERLCLDCSATVRGRADKKFCDDQCRSNYNNRLKAGDSVYLKEINQILRKNREILKSKNPGLKNKVKREALLRKGFNFSYHTHTYRTQQGKIYFFCYDYGYLELSKEDCLLVAELEKG